MSVLLEAMVGWRPLLILAALVTFLVVFQLLDDPSCHQTGDGLCCSTPYPQSGHPDFQRPGGPERLEDLLQDRRTGRFEIVSRSAEAATVPFYKGRRLVDISTYRYNQGWQWAGGRGCSGEWP